MQFERKGIAAIVLLSMFFLVGQSSVFAEDEPEIVSTLKQLDWNVSNHNKKKLDGMGAENINRFVNYILKDSDDQNMRGRGRVGEYQFIDLDNDNKYELVATLDYSGRAFFNTLIIIRKVNKDFRCQELYAFNITDLQSIVVDLDRDGTKELLMTKLFGTYRGSKPIASWTDIYKWDGKQYALVSEKYPAFYRKKVIELESDIKEIEKELKSDRKLPKDRRRYNDLKITAYSIELEKAKRLLNPGSKIGFERAVRLFNSDDIDSKFDALTIFEDIADEESMKLLREAARSSNQGLAMQAQAALETIGRRQREKK